MLNKVSGLVVLVSFLISFLVYRMADGFIQARKHRNDKLKSYNKWYVYLSFALAFGAIRIFLDFSTSAGIQTFNIPTPAMHPTMQPGDKVVASLRYYDNNPIRQGDIVVFNSPRGGIWTFRVIGLPGDSIEIREGKVYLNSGLNELAADVEYILDNQEVIQYREQLNPAKIILTLRHKNLAFPEPRTYGKTLVPENEYFLMGDNRDNAFDSRFIGTIKESDILGRVIYGYWGATSDRRNIDFTRE